MINPYVQRGGIKDGNCSQLTAEIKQMARLAAKTGFSLTPMTLKTFCLVNKQTQTSDWSQETSINKNANYVECHAKMESL